MRQLWLQMTATEQILREVHHGLWAGPKSTILQQQHQSWLKDSNPLSNNAIQMAPNQAKIPLHPSPPLGEKTIKAYGWSKAQISTVTPIISQDSSLVRQCHPADTQSSRKTWPSLPISIYRRSRIQNSPLPSIPSEEGIHQSWLKTRLTRTFCQTMGFILYLIKLN